MDENKHRMNHDDERNIIDLSEALREKEIQERKEEKARRKAEKPPILKRVLSFVLVAVIVFSCVMLTVYWDDLNFDAIRRSISYIGAEQDESGRTAQFEYQRGNENAFEVLGNHLAFATNKGVSVYDYTGKLLFSQDILLESPALDIGKNKAVAYDIGGSNLVVFDDKGMRLKLGNKDIASIYSATMNGGDWLAVTSQKKSQKGCVTVYNADMEKVFEFDSAARFITGAYVTEDCNYMVAHTMGQDNGVFKSEMVVYKLDREEPYASFTMENSMVLSIGAINGQTACVSDHSLLIAAPSGKVRATYEYEYPYLRDFSLDGDGFAALVLNRHRSGSSGKLVTINSSGEVIAALDLTAEVLDISAAGRYIAVLYTDELVIYNKDLTEYARFAQHERGETACMRSDGSVWSIGINKISLLIP